MTRVKPDKRKRVKAPKVRTGCRTCKSASLQLRRVKCDETHPACVRCTSTGRICDGYEFESSSSTPTSSTLVPAVPPSTSDPLERRSLQFFVEKTVTQFQTFFPDSLWDTCVLQSAYSHACIHHALVALSAHHERYLNPHLDGEAFALRHHNLAIKELLAPRQSSLPRYIYLLSCVIFICIEVLKGEHISAIYLFKHGRNMVCELRRHAHTTIPAGSDMDGLISAIEAFLHRLSVQVSLLAGDVDPDLRVDTTPPPKSAVRPLAPTFKSLLEAREAIFDLVIRFLTFPTVDSTSAALASENLARWSSAFDRLVEEIPDAFATRGVALLELQHRYLALNLSVPSASLLKHPDKLLVWDRYTDEFAGMLDLAALVVQPPDAALPQPQFHMDLGVLPLLFSIAARCRHPVVRRRAIALMKARPVQEGVWNGMLTAMVAERVVALEEDGREITSSEDIATDERVLGVFVHMHPDERLATVGYKLRDRSLEEVIRW